MESLSESVEKVLAELHSDDREVRAEYFKRFESEARVFSSHIAKAVMAWRTHSRPK